MSYTSPEETRAKVKAQVDRHTLGIVDLSARYETNDEESLAQRRILITGGASGIGEACTRKLSSLGAQIVIADLNQKLGAALEQDLQALGCSAKFVYVDVTSWQSQVNLFRTALEFFTGHEMDVLIPCAGLLGDPQWDVTPASPETLFQSQDAEILKPRTACLDVGLIGTMNSVHIAVKYCMGLPAASTSGNYQLPSKKAVVLIGSMAAYTYVANRPDYSGGKWALRGMFKVWRAEFPKLGARVNFLAPTFIDTPMTHGVLDRIRKAGGRLASMDDLVRAVTRMVGDQSMNGRALSITADNVTDLQDDIAGGEAGKVLREKYNKGEINLVTW